MTKTELKKQALELPVKERQELADVLWESLNPLTAEETALLDERLAAYRANPDDVYPAEEVHRDARARLRK